MIDRPLSRDIGRRVRARPGKCWRNAVRALCAGIPELARALYCEGSAFTGGAVSFPIQHAWLELPDGRVVDPTLPEASGHTAAARYTPGQLSTAMSKGTYPVTDEDVMDATHASVSRKKLGHRTGTISA